MLYKEEINEAVQKGIITSHLEAYSKQPGKDKTYIQDIIYQNQKSFFDLIYSHNAYIYVCGSANM
eukprot:Pgem_evm1s18207